jgi:hypothetical protein
MFLTYIESNNLKDGVLVGISRGRWRQYQILQSNKNLLPFLVETEIFHEDTFYRTLNQYLILRPCFGQHQIKITSIKGDQYSIEDGNHTSILEGKEEVFSYIHNEVSKTKQSYIIQNMGFLDKKSDNNMNEVLVTLQRKETSEWQVKDILKKNRLSKLRQKQLPQLLHEVAIMVAMSLEEFFPKCPTIVLELGFVKNKLWIQDIDLHFSKSKWSQFQILTSSKEINSFVPYTQLATPSIFLEYIKANRHVFLKPCLGQWGIGVLQVSLLRGGSFEIHTERNKVLFQNSQNMIDYLQTHYFSKKCYIVQEKVSLASIDDCPFDVRVMVQRDSYDQEWEITGIIAKVASIGFIVTNVAKSILPLEEALQKTTIKTTKSNQRITNEIQKICLRAAKLIGNQLSEEKIIGFDIGIDQKGEIWIIEANLRPDTSIFKRLDDQTMYNNIINRRKKK